MSLLPDDYWKSAAQETPQPTTPAAPQPQPAQPAFSAGGPSPVAAPVQAPVVSKPGFFESNANNIVTNNQLSQQEQIQKYGGVVGSPEYYQSKANENLYVKVGERLGPYVAAGAAIGLIGGPVGAAVGGLIGAGIGAMSYPAQDSTWDTLSTKGKIEYLANSGANGAVKLVTGLPGELVKTPVRYGVSVAQPWVRMATGKPYGTEDLAKLPVLDLPLLGKIPTYYQSYQEARDSGLGPLGAALGTGGTALGDAVMLGAIGEAGTKALQPRAAVRTPVGEATVQNIEPVKSLVTRNANGGATGVMKATDGAASEYYTLPKATSQQFGGHSGNTFFKLTPASPDAVELSVVQLRGGAIQKGVDWLRGTKTAQGDFGPEVKLQSQIVKLNQPASTEGKPVFFGGDKFDRSLVGEQGISVATNPKATRPFVGKFQLPGEDKLRPMKPQQLILDPGAKIMPFNEIPKEFLKTTSNGEIFPRAQGGGASTLDDIAQEILPYAKSKGYDAIDLRKMGNGSESEIRVINPNVLRVPGEASAPVSIPGSVVKGLEDRPITSDQLSNLGKIGDVNGVNPSVRDAVIRSVTGKSIMGEMTQTEYVKAAQTLGLFNGAEKYVPKDAFLNPAAQYLSPQRRWMRTYEENSGIPVYSEVYVPLEDAVRARDVFRDVWRGQSRDIFGKYAGPGYAAERQAINSYMQGDTAAVLGNPAFDAAATADMVKVADGMRTLYDQVGPKLGVSADIFLKDYSPHIQNIGGIFSLYKDGSVIPKSIDFFAKFKRKGSPTTPLIDDSLALFDMYVNAGSNSTFISPVLDRIGTAMESFPDKLHGSVKSYTLEKLGYGGWMERTMDEIVPAINRKLGVNLPPDTARRLGDTVLSTQYAGLLSQPATWFRQFMQYPLLGYSRLGPEFAVEAYKKALEPGALKELSAKGFLIDTSYPYGGNIAQEASTPGRLASMYKSTTQAVISPNSTADNIQRAVVYYQFKAQFENALSQYNAGKIPWSAFESKVDMGSFSPIDQNIARQRIVAGDVEGAFNHLVRDVIDETQFPYRKGSTMRFGYGFGGKLATSLLQWPLEASHTLGSWLKQGVRTGDFSKFIRYFAASTAMQRTMQNTFGWDFTRSLFLGPVLSTNFTSPAVQLAANTLNMVLNSPWVGAIGGANSRQTFNDSKDKVLKTLNSAGYPGGLEIQNIQKFKASIDRGPNQDGQYAALDGNGNVKYYTDFSGIFMGELMGFPIDQKVRESMINTEMQNAQVDQQQVKQKVMELLQQEKFDEASNLMAQYGINVTAQDMDNYYIPRSQRTFKSMPASIKAQYAPQVFPDTFKGVQ